MPPTHGSAAAGDASPKGKVVAACETPAAAEVMAANGAFPRDGLGASTDDVELRTRVFAHVKRYSTPAWGRALWETFHTLAFYILAFTLHGTAIGFLLVTLLRVRWFIIFHDCAHDAFFPSHTANRVMGLLFGTINHTPLSFWTRGHNHHHRHSNNLKYMQFSQSNPWTMEQWSKAPKWQRAMYRFAFTPLGFTMVVPFATFGVLHRFVSRWYEHVVDLIFWVFFWQIGLLSFEFWTFVASGIFGFFLFHCQHTFEGAQRKESKDWSFFENGMNSCSFLQIPWFAKYFTGNIEYHHIHHLSPLVPMYRLADCHNTSGDMFRNVPRVTLAHGLRWLTPMV